MFGPRLNEAAARPKARARAPFAAVDALVEEAYGLLEAQVREGMAAGVLANDPGPHAVIALWAAMHGLASLVLMKRVDVPPGNVGDEKLAARVTVPVGAGARGEDDRVDRDTPRVEHGVHVDGAGDPCSAPDPEQCLESMCEKYGPQRQAQQRGSVCAH